MARSVKPPLWQVPVPVYAHGCRVEIEGGPVHLFEGHAIRGSGPPQTIDMASLSRWEKNPRITAVDAVLETCITAHSRLFARWLQVAKQRRVPIRVQWTQLASNVAAVAQLRGVIKTIAVAEDARHHFGHVITMTLKPAPKSRAVRKPQLGYVAARNRFGARAR